MVLRRSCTVLAAAAAIAACDRQPKELPGGYTLIGSVNSELPILLQYDGECSVNLEAGELTVIDPEKYNSNFRIVRHCPEGQDSVLPDPGARDGRYQLTGDTLMFRDNTGAFAGIGVRNGDTLTITGTQHTLKYVRQP